MNSSSTELGIPPAMSTIGEVLMRMSLVSMICGTAFVWSTAVIGQEVKGEFPSPKTDEEMVANALSAAPESIRKNATVIAFDANGKVRTLQKGTNNFTCIPDDPTNLANDPNCVDANGLEWVMAWVKRSEPPKGKVGFGYMLQGGTTPSNVDPFATKPPEGMKWMQEPRT
jgi:hypothetical protein